MPLGNPRIAFPGFTKRVEDIKSDDPGKPQDSDGLKPRALFDPSSERTPHVSHQFWRDRDDKEGGEKANQSIFDLSAYRRHRKDK
jgi:hypothetical protein